MAKKTFEENLDKLEEIAKELENGNLSLEVSIKKFEEGMKLADSCTKKLDSAQNKINILLGNNDDQKPVPFSDQ